MMLVEINLLPKKEPRKFGFFAAMLIFAVVFLSIAAIYFWQIHSTNQQLEKTNKQLALLDKVIETKTIQSSQNKTPNSVNRLKKSIDWVESSKMETVPVLDELTSLLPERGFILSYQSETESDTVKLSVQFDTANDAAYYLNRLNQSKMVAEASIGTISSNPASTDGSATSNSSATMPGLGTNSQVQTSSGNLTNGNNSAGIKDVAGAVNGLAPVDPSSSNTQGIPRSLAQFTIKLNREEIKKIENNNNQAEGAAGP
ncbi:PilN domain-containing protein [Neobacillus sp. SM06]|uniref:PilN domain-containing protein n=1 Tax=Neobacillus sp. SM06 TaxID=3422492 RepID=UPI003D2A98DE